MAVGQKEKITQRYSHQYFDVVSGYCNVFDTKNAGLWFLTVHNPCHQASNEVLFLLGFPQTHDVADGVQHLVQERVLQCIVGLAVHNADRLGFWVAEADRT